MGVLPPKCRRQRYVPTRTRRGYMVRSPESGDWLSGRLSCFTRSLFASPKLRRASLQPSDRTAHKPISARWTLHLLNVRVCCVELTAIDLSCYSYRGMKH